MPRKDEIVVVRTPRAFNEDGDTVMTALVAGFCIGVLVGIQFFAPLMEFL